MKNCESSNDLVFFRNGFNFLGTDKERRADHPYVIKD
jgi:hypothetical protein